jgi:hypothetical protein
VDILSATVAVYEDGILDDGSTAKLYLTGIYDQIKVEAQNAAKALNMQPPFAMAVVHGVGVATGKAMTVTFNLMNIAAGDKIAILHRLDDGTWEVLAPLQVGNGTVKITIGADSVLAFVRIATDTIPRSPNSNDERNVMPWISILALLSAGMITMGIYVKKKRRA